jgi:hypothetical protein
MSQNNREIAAEMNCCRPMVNATYVLQIAAEVDLCRPRVNVTKEKGSREIAAEVDFCLVNDIDVSVNCCKGEFLPTQG